MADLIPDNDAEFIKALRDEGARIELEQQDEERRTLESYKSDIGDSLEEMLASRSKTIANLRDPDPKIRRIAITLLIDHFRAGRELMPVILAIIDHDENSDVRCAALSFVVHCFRRTEDKKTMRFLAGICADQNEDVRIRCDAYYSLQIVRGLSVDSLRKLCMERFPADCDWDLVRKYAD